MQDKNKSNTKGILLAGSIIAGSLLGFGTPRTINANNLFDYNNLGSGAELRSILLNTSPNRNLEMKCGNKSESKDNSKADSKTKDASCGANKKAAAKNSSEKAMSKKMDSKSKDGKCGEGKCGSTKKMSSKDKTPKEESKKQEQK